MMKLGTYLVISLHLFACFWHRLGQKEDDGDTWLDGGGGDGIRNSPIERRYIASFYYIITTLTSVGYGDYSAQSEAEEVYNIFIMIIGCVGYAFVIGSASSFLSNLNIEKKQRNTMLKALESFMAESGLPKELRIKCRTAMHMAYEAKAHLHRSKQTLETLPNSLQTEITLFIHRKIISDIKFLRENVDDHPHFVRHAAAMMQIPFGVQQGELIIQEVSETERSEKTINPLTSLCLHRSAQGKLPEDCYFLVSGGVIVVKNGVPILELCDNDFFGEPLKCDDHPIKEPIFFGKICRFKGVLVAF